MFTTCVKPSSPPRDRLREPPHCQRDKKPMRMSADRGPAAASQDVDQHFLDACRHLDSQCDVLCSNEASALWNAHLYLDPRHVCQARWSKNTIYPAWNYRRELRLVVARARVPSLINDEAYMLLKRV